MAEGNEIGPAEIPKHEDWSKWTIEQAVQAITGDSVDLTKLIDKQWFTFVPEGASNTWDFKEGKGKPDKMPGEMSYHAYGTQYYGVNIDHAAVTTFEDGFDKFMKMGPGLTKGIAGEMDASKLNGLRDKVVELQRFLDDRGAQYRQWAKLLDSNAADFDGKAAAVIQSRMDNYADSLEHWSRQLSYNYGLPLVNGVSEAAAALNSFNYMASAGIDFMEKNKIRDIVQYAIDNRVAEIYNWLNYWGLIRSDPRYYFLDSDTLDGFLEETRNRIMEQSRLWYMASGGTDAGWIEIGEKYYLDWVEWYIPQVMANFRAGDLRQVGTWEKLNKEITAAAQMALFAGDIFTRDAIKTVKEKYEILGRAFHVLDPAQTPPSNQFGPNGLGSGFPNSLFPNGMFDGMFPNGMFDNMFPGMENYNPLAGMQNYNPFAGMQNYNPMAGMQNYSPFAGMENYNPLAGMQNYNPLAGLENYNPFGGMPNGSPYDTAMPNYNPYDAGMPNGNPYGVGNPNMDAFGSPYSGYQNLPPYQDMPNYASPYASPYDQSPYGNYSPGAYAPGEVPGYGNYSPGGYAPGDFAPGMSNYSPGDFAPGDYAPGTGNYSPGDYGFNPGQFTGGSTLPPGFDLGPHGEVIGPDGKPQLGPNGELMGPGNEPVLGPYGQILGPDGQSLLGPNGELLGPDGGSLLGPQGQILGPDGQSLLGPNGELLGPDGEPILGTDGKPILGTPPAFDPGQYVPGGGSFDPGQYQPGSFDPGQFQPGGLPGGGSLDPGGAYLPGGTGGLGPGASSFDPGQFLDPGSIDPATFNPPQSRLDLPLDAYKSALQPPAYQPGVQLDSNGQAIPYGAGSGAGGPAGAAGLSGSPSSPAGAGGMGMGGMPFMPPMGGPMGGMGGPGGNKEERERQTWLSEDEEVWGTSVPVGAAVIGRPDEDEEEFDPDELVLPAGPVRTPRPGTPVPARAGTETGRDSPEVGGEDRHDDSAAQRS